MITEPIYIWLLLCVLVGHDLTLYSKCILIGWIFPSAERETDPESEHCPMIWSGASGQAQVSSPVLDVTSQASPCLSNQWQLRCTQGVTKTSHHYPEAGGNVLPSHGKRTSGRLPIDRSRLSYGEKMPRAVATGTA